MSNLKILGARKVTSCNVFAEVAQMLDATLRNLVTGVLCTPDLKYATTASFHILSN